MARTKSYSDTLKTVAANIKALRIKAGLTQEDMAEHGFNYRHYQKIESGNYSPNLKTLHRVAEVLNVNLSELVKSV